MEPFPTPMLHADFLCVEIHLIKRLKDEMPEFNGHVYSEADLPTNKDGPCCKVTPHALVFYTDGDFDTNRRESEFGSVAFYQQFEIWVGGQIEYCNGYTARRKLGPIISHLLGIDATLQTPAVAGVLPGWQPTPQHDMMQLVSGPRLELIENNEIIYLAMRFRCAMAITGTREIARWC